MVGAHGWRRGAVRLGGMGWEVQGCTRVQAEVEGARLCWGWVSGPVMGGLGAVGRGWGGQGVTHFLDSSRDVLNEQLAKVVKGLELTGLEQMDGGQGGRAPPRRPWGGKGARGYSPRSPPAP